MSIGHSSQIFPGLLKHMASLSVVTPLGLKPESLDGHGATAHIMWPSHQSAVVLSDLGQTLDFCGQVLP